MADSLGSAVLTLSVDDQQFKAGLNAAKTQAEQASGTIGRAFDGVAASLRNLAGFAGLVGLGVATQQIIATGQASQQAEIQLKSLAGAYGEAERAAVAVERVQKVLGISALEASQGFSQLYAALRGTGIGLDQLEVLFVGVSNAARLSGASMIEAQAGLLQLKQGLASGRLQGDELRSVLEQLPALAQAIATEMKTNVGALRQLGSDGKITSDIIFNAAKRLADATVPGRTQVEQLSLAWKSLQAQIAKAFGPALSGILSGFAQGLIAFRKYVEDNKQSLTNFAGSVVRLAKTLAPFVLGIMAVRAAFQAYQLAVRGAALAQAALLALQGPKGWAILASGIVASAMAAAGLDYALGGVKEAVAEAKKEADEAIVSFKKLMAGTEPPRAKSSVEELTKAVKDAKRAIADANEDLRIAGLDDAAKGIAQQKKTLRDLARQEEQAFLAYQKAYSASGFNLVDKGVIEAAGKLEVASIKIKTALAEGAKVIATTMTDAVNKLTESRLALSGILGDRDGGLNRFLKGGDKDQRTSSAVLNLRDQALAAVKTASDIFASQGVGNGVAAQLSLDFQRIFERARIGVSSAADLKAITDLINDVKNERNAIRNQNEAQRSIEQINTELVGVNGQLRDQIVELVKKQWNVVVNLNGTSGAQVLGDVVGAF